MFGCVITDSIFLPHVASNLKTLFVYEYCCFFRPIPVVRFDYVFLEIYIFFYFDFVNFMLFEGATGLGMWTVILDVFSSNDLYIVLNSSGKKAVKGMIKN